MSKLNKRNQEKVACKFCGEEFTKSGIKNHESNCEENPDKGSVLETEEIEEVEEDTDEVEESTEEEQAEEGDDEDEEAEADEVSEPQVPKVGMVRAFGIKNHSFVRFHQDFHIVEGKYVELEPEIFNVLLQQGIVIAK